MLIGLGTGSVGTYELAKRLWLPHEKHWLPWEFDEEKLDAALPEIAQRGGEVSLCFLPYVEAILKRVPRTLFVCMQRDQGRVVRGLAHKLGRNPFTSREDSAGYHNSFPFYGDVTLEEGVARFYREYYERAYGLQRRYPWSFRIFFTDHLLGSYAEDHNPRSLERFSDLCSMASHDFEDFCGDMVSELRSAS
jgi:hypothetical protein